METVWIAIWASGIGLLAVGVAWVVTGRLFPRSVPLDTIVEVSKLDSNKPETGLAAITQFYEWTEGRWSALAKGAGAASISSLVAVLGLAIGAAEVTTEVAQGAEGTTSTTTSLAAEAVPELVVVVALLLFVGALAWIRSSRVHLDFAEDLAAVRKAASEL